MLVALDANIVIYMIEANPIWAPIAMALDSVHLAAAIEHGCGLFLTADAQLARCTAISVEVLT